jgi:hypothetical protein
MHLCLGYFAYRERRGAGALSQESGSSGLDRVTARRRNLGLPMRRQVRAVVVDPTAPGKLAIKPIELRDPDRDEVAVRVGDFAQRR